MRLADVEWRTDKIGFLYCNVCAADGTVYEIWNDAQKHVGMPPKYTSMTRGDDLTNIGTTDLELACWLADKEPCEPSSSSASSSTT